MQPQAKKPFVSLVVPGFNEAAIIDKNLEILYRYMNSLESKYDWEMIFVDDGSTDDTLALAQRFAESRPEVHVLSHHQNFQLGQALRFAFGNCRGDYIVTMDVDLSYSPEHIGRLLETMIKTRAKIVLASPYMPGGQVSNVPWLRRVLSRGANRFLSMTAKGKIHTLTGMVRAYDRRFINSLNLKSMDMEINPEIIYKAQLLRAMIVELPGHLNWSLQKERNISRRSSMRIARGIASGLMSGFIFRPFMFFLIPGSVVLALSVYPITWAFIHTHRALQQIPATVGPFDYRLSDAVAVAFRQSPHTFVVAGLLFLIALNVIGLGFLSLQNKRYFEEVFHICTSILKSTTSSER